MRRGCIVSIASGERNSRDGKRVFRYRYRVFTASLLAASLITVLPLFERRADAAFIWGAPCQEARSHVLAIAGDLYHPDDPGIVLAKDRVNKHGVSIGRQIVYCSLTGRSHVILETSKKPDKHWNPPAAAESFTPRSLAVLPTGEILIQDDRHLRLLSGDHKSMETIVGPTHPITTSDHNRTTAIDVSQFALTTNGDIFVLADEWLAPGISQLIARRIWQLERINGRWLARAIAGTSPPSYSQDHVATELKLAPVTGIVGIHGGGDELIVVLDSSGPAPFRRPGPPLGSPQFHGLSKKAGMYQLELLSAHEKMRETIPVVRNPSEFHITKEADGGLLLNDGNDLWRVDPNINTVAKLWFGGRVPSTPFGCAQIVASPDGGAFLLHEGSGSVWFMGPNDSLERHFVEQVNIAQRHGRLGCMCDRSRVCRKRRKQYLNHEPVRSIVNHLQHLAAKPIVYPEGKAEALAARPDSYLKLLPAELRVDLYKYLRKNNGHWLYPLRARLALNDLVSCR